jgi:hypothetical protein
MSGSTEFAKAYDIANQVLDRPNSAVSADDVTILARQLAHTMSRSARCLMWLRTEVGRRDYAIRDRDEWFFELIQVLDPEGFAEGRYGEPSP